MFRSSADGTPPNQSLDRDRGRILSLGGLASLQRPRQVSFIVRPRRATGRALIRDRGELAAALAQPFPERCFGRLQVRPRAKGAVDGGEGDLVAAQVWDRG